MTARTRYEDWPSDDILTLRRLWAAGLSTAKIGEAMGRSKNSIVGKAHRLNLPGRPSPILRDRVRAKRKWPKRIRPDGQTLAPLPSAAASAVTAPPPPWAQQMGSRQPGPSPSRTMPALHSLSCETAIVMPDRPPASVASSLGLTGECCWPIGHPGAPGYRSCDSPCHRRANYFDAHAAIAYVRRRDADPDWLQPA